MFSWRVISGGYAHNNFLLSEAKEEVWKCDIVILLQKHLGRTYGEYLGPKHNFDTKVGELCPISMLIYFNYDSNLFLILPKEF